MKHGHLILISLLAALLGACASHPGKTVSKARSIPAGKAQPVLKTPASKEAAPAKEAVREESSSVNLDIVGTPLFGGKFAKLKIGMPVKQVEELIGTPDRQWQQATGDGETPYYTGTDHWLIQYAYKNEGMLTFNFSPEHLLIRILVNRAE